jgi:hypothetical protein
LGTGQREGMVRQRVMEKKGGCEGIEMSHWTAVTGYHGPCYH